MGIVKTQMRYRLGKAPMYRTKSTMTEGNYPTASPAPLREGSSRPDTTTHHSIYIAFISILLKTPHEHQCSLCNLLSDDSSVAYAAYLCLLDFLRGETYVFDQLDASNWYHPLGFAYYPDGAHEGVDELEEGVGNGD